MTDGWILSMRPTFLAEWLALPQKNTRQVHEKLRLLVQDPLPDGKTRKQLANLDSRLYRLRSGDYRIFYTIDRPYVSLLAVRKRDESTYDRMPEAESLGGLDVDVQVEGREVERLGEDGPPVGAPSPMPEEFNADLLWRLRIPEAFHATILSAQSEDELLELSNVPDAYLLTTHEALFERPLVEVLDQTEFVAQDADALIRYKEGQLLGFLLRLDPEQERFVAWAASRSGPTLVKGTAGTGKSTVALYRVKTYVDAMRREGASGPRILFTTYTNALVSFSKQLLGELLGSDASCVEVRTADSVAREIVKDANQLRPFPSMNDIRQQVEQAIRKTRFLGDSLAVRSQQDTLRQLGSSFLEEEFLRVIQARGLNTVEDYLSAKRHGRKQSLNDEQRKLVWAAYETFDEAITGAGRMTWQTLRATAAELVGGGSRAGSYSAVVVDEVQDLDPSLIQMLVGLCRSPGSVFMTADANQSIYGSGFRWTDVHESLRFQGRTGTLKINHRSTREISEAARSYLKGGELEEVDEETDSTDYAHAGPLPAVRYVQDQGGEARLIGQFLPLAAKQFHLARSACAVLVPTEAEGRRIATQLQGLGHEATFMTGRELDLSAQCIKVLTLKSSKGLEFPIVAVAGFFDAHWPPIPSDMPQPQQDEWLAQERRTLYVAMTRAMRALLVACPAHQRSSLLGLLSPFDPSLWNTDQPVST